MNQAAPLTSKRPTNRANAGDRQASIGFLAPALIVVFVMSIFPLISSLILSLTTFQFSASGLKLEWVGLGNFISIVSDGRFWGDLGNTLIYVFGGVLLQYALGLGLAMLLTQRLFGQRFFRVLFLIPMMITPVAVAYIMKMVLNFEIGPLAPIMKPLGINTLPWFADANLSRLLVIIGDAWQWTPFVIIVLLAGLEGLPHEPYEAARVDGATPWQMFTKITFPMLLPVSSGVILIRMVEAFKIVDMPVVLTGGGPGTSTESLTLFAYYTWRNFQLGKTAAIAYLLVITVSIIGTIYSNTIRKRALEVAG
jgi:multiple sugar transport system permease protein